jgi:hypothetical protein
MCVVPSTGAIVVRPCLHFCKWLQRSLSAHRCQTSLSLVCSVHLCAYRVGCSYVCAMYVVCVWMVCGMHMYGVVWCGVVCVCMCGMCIWCVLGGMWSMSYVFVWGVCVFCV